MLKANANQPVASDDSTAHGCLDSDIRRRECGWTWVARQRQTPENISSATRGRQGVKCSSRFFIFVLIDALLNSKHPVTPPSATAALPASSLNVPFTGTMPHIAFAFCRTLDSLGTSVRSPLKTTRAKSALRSAPATTGFVGSLHLRVDRHTSDSHNGSSTTPSHQGAGARIVDQAPFALTLIVRSYLVGSASTSAVTGNVAGGGRRHFLDPIVRS